MIRLIAAVALAFCTFSFTPPAAAERVSAVVTGALTAPAAAGRLSTCVLALVPQVLSGIVCVLGTALFPTPLHEQAAPSVLAPRLASDAPDQSIFQPGRPVPVAVRLEDGGYVAVGRASDGGRRHVADHAPPFAP